MKRAIATAGVAALALGLTACGGSDDKSSSGSGDKIKIGIKYDQPGLGLKAGSDYKGLDVDVAKYVAKEMGYGEDKIDFVESPSKQREKMLEAGTVKMIFATYSITDPPRATAARSTTQPAMVASAMSQSFSAM